MFKDAIERLKTAVLLFLLIVVVFLLAGVVVLSVGEGAKIVAYLYTSFTVPFCIVGFVFAVIGLIVVLDFP